MKTREPQVITPVTNPLPGAEHVNTVESNSVSAAALRSATERHTAELSTFNARLAAVAEEVEHVKEELLKVVHIG